MKALTYGDTFTLPSAPDVTWKIVDRRTLDEFASHREEVAYARPVDVSYDEPIKIGRAERVGVEISFTRHGSTPAEPWPSTRSYSERLTDAQRDALRKDLAALTFDLPPMTAEDVRGYYVTMMAGAARSVVREWEQRQEMPRYSPEERHAITSLIDDETRETAIKAAVAAFEAEIRERSWR